MSLRKLIGAAGLSQKDVASSLGTSGPNVSRWVNGEADVPSHFIRPLADLLKVTAAEIVEHGVQVRPLTDAERAAGEERAGDGE